MYFLCGSWLLVEEKFALKSCWGIDTCSEERWAASDERRKGESDPLHWRTILCIRIILTVRLKFNSLDAALQDLCYSKILIARVKSGHFATLSCIFHCGWLILLCAQFPFAVTLGILFQRDMTCRPINFCIFFLSNSLTCVWLTRVWFSTYMSVNFPRRCNISKNHSGFGARVICTILIVELSDLVIED